MNAPVAPALFVSALEDGPALTVTADFTDVDASDTHSFDVDVTGTLGTVVNHGDGTFTYDPAGAFEHLAAGETATDTFLYRVTDSSGLNSQQTVTVTITGQNDAPVALALAGTVLEDGPALTVTADFTDVDASDTHSFEVDVTGTLGTVVNHGDGTFTYDPAGAFEHLAAGETATDTFLYRVTDSSGLNSQQTVTVTITGQNDAPVALALAGSVLEDGPALTVTADFTDVDASDTHSFEVDVTGTLGTVVNHGDGTFTYDPAGAFEHLAAGETATDTFLYRVTDSSGLSSQQTVTVTITGQNDAPVAVALAGTVLEDGPALTVTADFTDADASDTHSFDVDVTGTLGTVVNHGDGTFTYDPAGAFEHLAAGETATDTFLYRVTDSNGLNSQQTVTVTITGQNDAPVALALAGTVLEDGPALTVTADFTDVDASDTHSFDVDVTGTLGTVVNHGDGTFTYDPAGAFEHLAAGETATDTFLYRVTDSNGLSSQQTVTVTITGQNDAPVAQDLSVTVSEDGPSLLFNPVVTDVDGDTNFYFTINTANTVGSVINNGDGTFGYDPRGRFDWLNPGQAVSDTFEYTVSDNHGGITTYTVTINVTGQVEPSKLFASDGRAGDAMYWVAINASGVVLAGAQNGDGAFQDQGSAYLFRPDATGSYTALKLTASDGAAGDRFGVSVALNNAGVAVVGSHYDVTDSNVRTGSAYVYRPDGQGGYYETKLVPPDGVSGGQFGYAVSINDAGVIAVGSYLDNAKAAKSGSVYVYRPDGFGGYAVTKVTASDGAAGDQFGNSVTMTESGRLIVGAYMDDTTVNDTGAVYIYEFTAPGSVASEVKLLASDGATGDEFGLRTASNAAGVIVVSAHLADNGGVLDSGAVYVYTPNGFGGYTEKKLSALDEFAGDGFGYSIAINDDGVIVAGALWNDDAGSNSGSAYVFVPDGLGGYTQFKLTAHDGQAGDLFGRSVSINSDGVVTVAAQLGDGAAVNSGAVYTFVPNADGNYVGSNGTVYQGVPLDGSAIDPIDSGSVLPSKLFASDGRAGDAMYWVAINASGVVLAGAQNGDGAFQDQGSAYLFRPDATGSYTALKLTASDGAAGDRFGVSVALNNAGVAVVGSHYDVTDSNVRTGSAYVYRPDGQGGYYETKLVPPDGVSGGQFGYAVSINDAGVIAVGSYLDNAKAAKSGSVYVYRPDGFGGYAVTKVTASDGAAGDQFGNSVTMTESGRLIVGAYMDDTTVNDTGAVYIYEFTAPGSVASEVKLLASDGATGDEFGLRTASNAAGVIVVSAHLADNGGVLDSGAVYVYTPNGFGGYTEKKLSALDEFAGDGFGYSIAINDDGVIVAGALWNDDAGSNSGSAYVFVPDGLGGYTQFKLTAHDGQAGDLFGRSVSINSDGVVTVAAQLGDGAAVNSGAVYTFVPNADGNYVGSNGTVYQGVPDPQTALMFNSAGAFEASETFDFSSSYAELQDTDAALAYTTEGGADGVIESEENVSWTSLGHAEELILQDNTLDSVASGVAQPWSDWV